MTTQQTICLQKLQEYYSSVFEEELINEIVACGTIESLSSNKKLIEIGDLLTHIPLILSGAVKIVREDKNGNEMVLYYLEKGDSCAISFINCIDLKKSILRAVTEKSTEFIKVPIEKVELWMIKYSSWRHYLLDSYHMRLLEMVEAIDSLAFMKLDDRLYKYLQERVKIMKSHTLNITHKEIANDLNSSRVVVSRLLKILENEGKIRISRNKIIIDNL